MKRPDQTRPNGRVIRIGTIVCILLLSALAAVSPAAAQGGDPNACDAPGDSPDVIVGDIHQKQRWGEVGGITSFSIGTTSCNVGTCWLNWISSTNQHPVIGQNMYRLKDGRFEHIGQSWLKHGFFALSDDLCAPNQCQSTNGSHLGVNCSDPYSSNLNGDQDRLGPKFEVNAASGDFPYPATDMSETGDAIFKRLQVHNDDLDPGLNPDALYFVEAQYIAADDAAAKNNKNNASYRKVDVFGSSGNFDFDFDGETQREEPGINAWKVWDTGVQQTTIAVPNDGILGLAVKVTALGNGMWHYEYALHNLTSHRSVGAFEVPVQSNAVVENVGFHDVDYHSGEPFDGTDWPGVFAGSSLTWATETFDVEPNANALRWGTLYNFRFDADVPPETANVTIGLFRPGSPETVTASTLVPGLCNNDSFCDENESSCSCSNDCGEPTASELTCGDTLDNDCDGLADCLDADCCGSAACPATDFDGDEVLSCTDCNDSDIDVWETPGEALDLTLAKNGSGAAVLSWSPPVQPGSSSLDYSVLRARDPAEWIVGTSCLVGGDPTATTLEDPQNPFSKNLFAYLIQATNGCPVGNGTLGTDSQGVDRVGIVCP